MCWRYILLPLLLLNLAEIRSQTCCSGGVPMTGNLGLPAASKSTLQISLTYDQNFLNTLKNGREDLDDNSRKRLTRSVLLEAGYSLTNTITISTLLTYVVQSREISQFGNTNSDRLYGVGDGVILITGRIGKDKLKKRDLLLGIGSKLPIGKSDMSNPDGIKFSADLQPGSGAWDGIIWGSYFQQLPFRPSLSFSARNIFRFTGANNNYLGFARYSFGDELQFITGISDRLIIGKILIDPSLHFRFRHAGPDVQDDFKIPNTGGSWIYLAPGIGVNLSPSAVLSFQAEIPLYSKLVGTQLTTDYRFSAGLYMRLEGRKDNVFI